MKKTYYRSALALSLVVAAWAGVQTIPASSAVVQATAAPSAKLSITTKSYIQVSQAYLVSSGKNQRALFQITLYNRDSKEISLNDYFVKLYSKSGTPFTLASLPGTPETVAPNASVTMQYYADVSPTLKLSDLVVKWMKWDFSSTNYEKTVGQINLSAAAPQTVALGKEATVTTDQAVFGLQVKALRIQDWQQSRTAEINVQLVNRQKQGQQLPELHYYLRTSNGYQYPLQLEGTEAGTSLNPLVAVNGRLSGTLPLSASKTGLQLWITQTVNVDNSTIEMPLTSVQLPAPVAAATGKGSFANESGSFAVTLSAAKRWPWEDQDLVTSELTLSTPGKSSLLLPQISGYFMLDGAVKVDAQLLKTDNTIGVAPGEQVHYEIVGKIPYTYNYKKIDFYLTETPAAEGQTEPVERVHISVPIDNSKAVEIPVDGEYSYSDIGKSFTYRILQTTVYSGLTDDLYTAELELGNTDKRFSAPDMIVAQLKGEDGTIYPAAVENVTSKISPGGKAVVAVSTVIPKELDTDNWSLLIGQAISGGKLATAEQTADGYIRPVTFTLPGDSAGDTSDTAEMKLAPYTIDLTDFKYPYWYYNEMSFGFNYNLSKSGLVTKDLGTHQLLIAMEDADGKEFYTQALSLEDSDDPNATILELGEHTLKLSKEFSDVMYNSSNYSIKVYDLYQGSYRKLLGSYTYVNK